MSKVNIVYTNGVDSYRVYWVKQNSQGDIYHGFVFNKKVDFHYSYHKSGKAHISEGRKKLPMGNRIPTKDIKDIQNLINFNPGNKEWAEKYFRPYGSNMLKNIVWVDSRLFPNDIQIQVELYLVKPECISSLANQQFRKKCKDDYRLVQIIQDIKPWLIVHIRNLKYIDVKSQN